jgi:hypothetical protein
MKFLRKLDEAKLEWAAYFLTGIFLSIQTLLLFISDIRSILPFLPDDTAYYFKIVENLHAGNGLSFDGLHKTDGFHPLWLYLLTGVRFFLTGTPESIYRIFLFVQLLLITGSIWLIWITQRRIFGKRIALFGVGLFLLCLFFQSLNGLETALQIFMLCLFFYVGSKFNFLHDCGNFTGFLPGLFLGLIFLARLDMVFLIAALYPLLLSIPAINTREIVFYMKKIVWLTIGIAVVTLPYLIFNYLQFGHIVPISGQLKSSFPLPGLNLRFDFKILDYLTIFPSLILALGYIGWFIKQRQSGISISAERKYYRGFTFLLANSIVLHFLYYTLFMRWEHSNWAFYYYNLIPLLVSAEVLTKWLRGMSNTRKNFLSLSFTLGVCLVLMFKSATRISNGKLQNWHSIAYEAALWSRAETPKEAVFAMVDAGNFSYFSERKVINLDGLVNNLEFQNALNGRALNGYLKNNKVTYLVMADTAGKFQYIDKDKEIRAIAFESFLSHTMSDPVIVRGQNMCKSIPWNGPNGPTSFVIWKLD